MASEAVGTYVLCFLPPHSRWCCLTQVYIIGDVGIQEEMDLLGIQHTGGPSDNGKVVELKPGYAMPHDKDVSPVSGQWGLAAAADSSCAAGTALC